MKTSSFMVTNTLTIKVLLMVSIAAIVFMVYIETATGTDEGAIWPASPFDSIPFFTNISDRIVLGTVTSRTELVQGGNNATQRDYYYTTLRVEQNLKGSGTDSVVFRVDHGRLPLGDLYRPDIQEGERVLLFLGATDDTQAPYMIGSEERIWRIEGNKVYNKWGKEMREIQSTKQPDRRMPPWMIERWGQTFTLHRFIHIVRKAVLGETSKIWGDKPSIWGTAIPYVLGLILASAMLLLYWKIRLRT